MSQLHYSSHRTRYGSSARARGGRRGGCLVQGLLSSMERQAREDARAERRRWKALTPEQQDAELAYEGAVNRLFEAGWAVGGGVLWWIGASLLVFLGAKETPSVWTFAAVALFTVGIKALAFLSEAVGGYHERKVPAHLVETTEPSGLRSLACLIVVLVWLTKFGGADWIRGIAA